MWEFWQLAREGSMPGTPRGEALSATCRRTRASTGLELGPAHTPGGARPPARWPLAAGADHDRTVAPRPDRPRACARRARRSRRPTFAAPAQRTDGRSSSDPLALPEGAHLRLDPHLDLARLNLPPLTRMIAQAAQRYGIIVRDYPPRTWRSSRRTQRPRAKTPLSRPERLFLSEGRYPSQLLASFPWEPTCRS